MHARDFESLTAPVTLAAPLVLPVKIALPSPVKRNRITLARLRKVGKLR
jgi:hypothetical protein